MQRFLPLARSLARRYERSSEPLDDLVQVASLGLLKAIDRFDPARAVAFSSFAVPTIVGELKRHFRDKGWWLRVPRDLQELAFRVERVADDLAPELGRAPTPDEIAGRSASASSRCSTRATPPAPAGRSRSTLRTQMPRTTAHDRRLRRRGARATSWRSRAATLERLLTRARRP